MDALPSAVLFACTLNSVRSPIAESIAKHLFGRSIYFESVGVRPEDDEADPFAIMVMDEIGIDLSRHRPRSFDELEDSSFDLIITLSPEAQHKAVDMTRTMACDVIFWNTMDPTVLIGHGNRDQILGAYRSVRDSLMTRIKEQFDFSRPAGL